MEIQTGDWNSESSGVEELTDLAGMGKEEIKESFPNGPTRDRMRLCE